MITAAQLKGMNTYAAATKEGISDSMKVLEGVMFKKNDEEDS